MPLRPCLPGPASRDFGATSSDATTGASGDRHDEAVRDPFPAQSHLRNKVALLLDFSCFWPVRPPDEPPSPANALMGMTFVFVAFAFVVPLLLLGMKSQNADIAGKNVPLQ